MKPIRMTVSIMLLILILIGWIASSSNRKTLILKTRLYGTTTLIIVICGLAIRIKNSTKNQIFPLEQLKIDRESVILVPGAGIYNSQPGRIYQERLDTALQLIQIEPELKIIISADNSRNEYNETAVGFHYLLKHKTHTGNIFLDFAGFDTYDSIYRAKVIFQAKKLIIISQKFALPRALFIANQLNIPAIGVIAGSEKTSFRNFLREKLANIKAFYESSLKIKPHFLGQTILLDEPSNSRKYLDGNS